jgi:hypothetical protein
MTNSKLGKTPSTDGAPALKPAARVFGESPVKRALTGRHPARADSVPTEEGNLKAESEPTSMVRG